MEQNVLILIRGDSYNRAIECTTEDDVVVDITGKTIYFTVKKNLEDADPGVLQINWNTHTNPTLGLTTFNLTSAQTNIIKGEYVFDFQIEDATGARFSTYAGTLTVTQDVTNH